MPRLPRRCAALVSVAFICLALTSCASASSPPPGKANGVGQAVDLESEGFDTRVSITGTDFRLNGEVTHPGTAVEGLLLNARMVQAVFDDENPSTRKLWAYPDTRAWDPERNTNEFVHAVPTYAEAGLKAVTINLQGGRPVQSTHPLARSQPWNVSAYRGDGSLKSAWLARLDRAIRTLDANGMVCILGLFYFGQDQRLRDEAAVVRAVDNVTDWLLAKRYTNVLVEVNNEADNAYNRAVLRPGRVDELIKRIQTRSNGALLVSTSFTGGTLPPQSVIAASDYVLLHGNGQSPDELRDLIAAVRATQAYRAAPKPIVFNEDSPRLENLEAAVSSDASWGYHDKGDNNYEDGFQAPPVNWRLTTETKRAFFNRLAALTRPAAGSDLVLVSGSPDRSESVQLAGQTVTGPVFVFVPTRSGIARVQFYLDDPEMTGPPERIERAPPFDLAATALDAAQTANPFDSTRLADGKHTLTAALILTDATTKVVQATFNVYNAGGA